MEKSIGFGVWLWEKQQQQQQQQQQQLQRCWKTLPILAFGALPMADDADLNVSRRRAAITRAATSAVLSLERVLID